MIEINLTKGKVTIVDDEDYERLSKHRWHCIQDKYAVRDAWVDGKRKHIRMNREIMGFPEGLEVDHINRDSLDNRKENLRIVTHTINTRNNPRKNTKNRTSDFIGVHLDKKKNVWIAMIMLGGKQTYLGGFKEEENAARAYNIAAKKNGFLNLNPVSGEITETISHIHGRKTYLMSQFDKVRSLYDDGSTQAELGRMYNVTSSAIRMLLKRKGVL